MELTREETLSKIAAAVREAENRILPAKLVSPLRDGPNGFKIAAGLRERNLDMFSPDSYVTVFNAIYASLDWVVKPAALVRDEKANAPAVLDNPLKLQAERTAKIAALDAATAKEKLDAASLKQIFAMIELYRPSRFGPGGGRLDYPEIETQSKHWKKCLAESQAMGENLQEFATRLQSIIQARYEEREKRAQRM